MDLAVGAAEEREFEHTGAHRVSGGDDGGLDGSGGRGRRGCVDRDVRELVAEPAQVLRRPMVGMLVRHDHADDAVEVCQSRGQTAGIDHEGLAGSLDGEKRVRVLCDVHMSSMPAVRTQIDHPGGEDTPEGERAGGRIWRGAEAQCMLGGLPRERNNGKKMRPHRIAA